jgi:hypothetical protein
MTGGEAMCSRDVKEAHANGLDSRLAPVLYGIAFYRDDTSEVARQVASAAGKTEDESCY